MNTETSNQTDPNNVEKSTASHMGAEEEQAPQSKRSTGPLRALADLIKPEEEQTKPHENEKDEYDPLDEITPG
jgi:hypothetical protein